MTLTAVDNNPEDSPLPDKVLARLGPAEAFAMESGDRPAVVPARINATPREVERGLAQLVLTIIELLRRLMEQQAIRRIEAGALTDEEIERIGETFLRLDAKMRELTHAFDLQEDDLNINLGPLGNLL